MTTEKLPIAILVLCENPHENPRWDFIRRGSSFPANHEARPTRSESHNLFLRHCYPCSVRITCDVNQSYSGQMRLDKFFYML